MTHRRISVVSAVLAFGLAGFAAAESADEIIARLDANMSYADLRYVGRLEITVGAETRYKTLEVASEGSTKAFAEFTNPEDRGTRYLKLDKNLWIYFPKEQDTVRIAGRLLKEGAMGSDFSYEDILESSDFLARYSAVLKGKENVDGRPTFVVELVARAPAAAYERRVLWVDAERYVALRQEMYAKSGRLLKTGAATEVSRIGERWYPTRQVYESKLRNNTTTLFAMSGVEFGAKLDERLFSLSALSR